MHGQQNNKYLNYVILYLQLTQYIHNIRFQFRNCPVLVIHQATIHNRCSKYPSLEPTHTWAYLAIGHSHLFKCPAAVANGFTSIKSELRETCLCFQFELNTPGVLSVSTDKHLNGLRSSERGAIPRELLEAYIGTNKAFSVFKTPSWNNKTR